MAAELAYRVGGEGEAIVLLHPVGLDSTFWEPVAAALESRFRVFRIDFPGHGQTPLTDEDPTLSTYADHVADFIAEQCGGARCVIGLSFGGMTAQELALRHPDRLQALALCGCGGMTPPEARAGVRERGLAAMRGGMAAVVDATLERWFTPEFLAAGGAEDVRRRLETDDPAGWDAAWNAISQHDALPRLKDLRLPVLCLAGEHDRAAPPEAMRKMADAIPLSRFEVLPGSPHMMQVETPDAMSGRLTAFLTSLE